MLKVEQRSDWCGKMPNRYVYQIQERQTGRKRFQIKRWRWGEPYDWIIRKRFYTYEEAEAWLEQEKARVKARTWVDVGERHQSASCPNE